MHPYKFILFENKTGPIILVALSAQQTPILMSYNGTSRIILELSADRYVIESLLVHLINMASETN